jgi:hypothetical protein
VLRGVGRAAAGVVAVALAVTGCGGEPEPEEWQGICIDPRTELRLDDDACERDGGIYHVVFFPAGMFAPAVGKKASGYRTAVPAGATYRRSGAPTGGGTVARAGSGGSGGRVGTRPRVGGGGRRGGGGRGSK